MKWNGKKFTRNWCEFSSKINFFAKFNSTLTQSTEIVNKRKTCRECECVCCVCLSEYGLTITLSIGLHHIFFWFTICSSAFKCAKEAQLFHTHSEYITHMPAPPSSLWINWTIYEEIYTISPIHYLLIKRNAKRMRMKWQKEKKWNAKLEYS